MSDFEAALAALKQAKTVLCLTHVQPDGDGLGSQLALVLGLRQLGKECWTGPQEAAKVYGFLDIASLQVPEDRQGGYDLAVTLDCPVAGRLGKGAALLAQAKQVLVIDHHADSQPFGTLKWFDMQAAATGEMVFALLESLGVKLDKAMATGMYTALVTDTGSFRYSNTSTKTHRLAASLLEAGARPYEVSRSLFESQPLSTLKLLAASLGRIRLEKDGKIGLLSLPLEVFGACQAREEESESLVNYVRGIEGVEAAMFLRESSDGSLKLSLRSKGNVDVREVAAKFHGGGHKAAAGATLNGTLAEAEAKVLTALKEAF